MERQDLIHVRPRDLTFIFEVKKQSSCSIQLVNLSDKCVAFKVKTTSPARYCVRPSVGIIQPGSSSNFTVTMQAQPVAPPDMQLKDKFLIQSTVVPCGLSEDDIVSSIFSKETGKYVEECKLKVLLVSPPPPLLELQTDLEIFKQDATLEIPETNQPPVQQGAHNTLEDGIVEFAPSISVESKKLSEEPIAINQEATDVEQPHISCRSEEAEVLKVKLSDVEIKLQEAQKIITCLTEENNKSSQERNQLQHEKVFLRRRCAANMRAGFPLSFVVFTAFIGMVVGLLMHS